MGVGNEFAEGGITKKVQKEGKLENYLADVLKADGAATQWAKGNQTEDPPQHFKGSSYAFMIKHWLKKFNASQFTVVTLKQYQTRTDSTLKFIATRLGMGMIDTKEM